MKLITLRKMSLFIFKDNCEQVTVNDNCKGNSNSQPLPLGDTMVLLQIKFLNKYIIFF